MKELLLLICLLSAPLVWAESPVWGVRVGSGLATGYGVPQQAPEYKVKIQRKLAYQAGFYLQHQVTENFAIQNELLYSRKGSRQDIEHLQQPVQLDVLYDLAYLELPLLLQLRLIELGKNSVWSVGGFSFSYLLDSQYDLSGRVEFGDDELLLSESYELDMIDEFDFSLLYGLVWKFYLGGWKLNLEYRFALGWQSISFPTYGAEAPVSLSNQSHQLILGWTWGSLQ
ncbi:MAG: outer membrane beta-barrel protein [Candidatus Cloacimonadales bacterium]